MDIFDAIRKVKDREAMANADQLPEPDEFRELSSQFRMASLCGGMQLTANQCDMLSKTFATLAVSVIATPTD